MENYFLQKTLLSKRRRNNLVAILGAGLGIAFMSSIVGNYLSYYYTEFMLLDPALVGSILSIGIYVGGQGEVTDSVILMLKLLFVVIPAVALSFSGVLFYFINLPDSRIKQIRADIVMRYRGG